MSVRAKFRCCGINHVHTGGTNSVAAISRVPVWEQEGVNKQWSHATPQGKIEMTITNPDAVEQFELGKEYFVDFTPANG